jgi:hypothetical protein
VADIGLHETQGSTARHANVPIDVFVDQNRYDLSNGFARAGKQHNARKAVAKLIENLSSGDSSLRGDGLARGRGFSAETSLGGQLDESR